MDHFGPTLVSHSCLYLSARPINHFFWHSVSCGDSDSIIQGSCPHKWGQDVSCGYLMRRWQLILELLLHYTLMAVSLHLCFPLGRSGGLPLVACYFLLPWSWFAEDLVILNSISWQSGLSMSFLGHFFLLGMGHGLDMKWVEVLRFFGPTILLSKLRVKIIWKLWFFFIVTNEDNFVIIQQNFISFKNQFRMQGAYWYNSFKLGC